MKAIYFLKVRMTVIFIIGAYAHSFAQRCFQDMLSAEELDDEFQTLDASLLELNKPFSCSERFMANSMTLNLGNNKLN